MQRALVFILFLALAACSKDASTASEEGPREAMPPPEAPLASPPVPSDPPNAKPIADDSENDWETPSPDPPSGMHDLFKDMERSGPVVGDVERVATVTTGFLRLLHEVKIAGEYAYVQDSGGMLFRVAKTGGEFEVVHDSKRGASNHASLLESVENEIYFSVDLEDDKGELRKVGANGVVTLAKASDVLELAGNKDHIFVSYFQKDDIHRLGKNGLELFAKSLRPGSPMIAGDYLYWSHYKSGRVYRAALGKKGKAKQIAKGRGVIGLAVIGNTLYFGTEKDGGIHTVTSAGGRSKRIADGFNNHDMFVSDGAGVYFWTWGRPGAVLRLDAETHKVETMVSGVDATRGLALDEGWLYLVEGPDLFRVRTDARMPWPMK